MHRERASSPSEHSGRAFCSVWFFVPLFGVSSLLASASPLFRCIYSRCPRCTRKVHNASAACGTWIAAMDGKPEDSLHHLAFGRCFGDSFLHEEWEQRHQPTGTCIFRPKFLSFLWPAKQSTSRALQKRHFSGATELFFSRESGGTEGGGKPVCTLCNAARTFISAINSSFFMFCFSVTRMPFSSRMALQRGSTLSLISTEVMEIGAMSTLRPRAAKRGNWCWWTAGVMEVWLHSVNFWVVIPDLRLPTLEWTPPLRASPVCDVRRRVVGTSRLPAFRPGLSDWHVDVDV